MTRRTEEQYLRVVTSGRAQRARCVVVDGGCGGVDLVLGGYERK